MLRTLNKVSGYIAGIILYPLKSLFVNFLVAAATVSIATLILIGLPFYYARNAYNAADERKFSAAVFAGIQTAVYTLTIVPLFTGIALTIGSIVAIYDVVNSAYLGAVDGYERGLFYYVLKKAFTKFTVFSTSLDTISTLVNQRNTTPINQHALEELLVDSEMDYTNLVDVPRPPKEVPELFETTEISASSDAFLTENEINEAQKITGLQAPLTQYKELYKRLSFINQAMDERSRNTFGRQQLAKVILGKVLELHQSTTVTESSTKSKDFGQFENPSPSIEDKAQQLISHLQDPNQEANFRKLVKVLTVKHFNADCINKNLELLRLIQPSNFSKIAKAIHEEPQKNQAIANLKRLNQHLKTSSTSEHAQLINNAHTLIPIIEDNTESLMLDIAGIKNTDTLAELLGDKDYEKNLPKILQLFKEIHPDHFGNLAKLIRGDSLNFDFVSDKTDFVSSDEIFFLDIENPALMVKLYEYEPNKWRPIISSTKIIDFANLEEWLTKNNSHPLTREPLDNANPYELNGVRYNTKYRIYPYKGFHSSHELKLLAQHIRTTLAANTPPSPFPRPSTELSATTYQETSSQRFFEPETPSQPPGETPQNNSGNDFYFQ